MLAVAPASGHCRAPRRVTAQASGTLACPAPGNCVAGGTFVPERGRMGAFAVGETAGRWDKAVSLSGAKLRFTNLAQIFATPPSQRRTANAVVGSDFDRGSAGRACWQA